MKSRRISSSAHKPKRTFGSYRVVRSKKRNVYRKLIFFFKARLLPTIYKQIRHMKKTIRRRNKYGQMITIGHLLTKQNLKLQGDDGMILILNIRNPKSFLDEKGPDTFIFEPDRETERFILNKDCVLVSDGPKALLKIYKEIMLLDKVHPDEFVDLIHQNFFYQVW